MRANIRARLNMPTEIMLQKLIKNKIARRTHDGNIMARPVTSLVNLDHATIIQFYNSKIHGVLNYYSFAGNRVKILNLIWIFKHSLAKTLARKYKLRSSRQVFKKFGTSLKDPQTGMQLYAPKSLPVIHKYNNTDNLTPATELMDQT